MTNEKKVKYLMFDHGGVLEGRTDPNYNEEKDLSISDFGDVRSYLPDGKAIFQCINTLVNTYGYKFSFHSTNQLKDLMDVIQPLAESCAEAGISFPEIAVIPIKDKNKYPQSPIDNPFVGEELLVINQKTLPIPIIGWMSDDNHNNDGKRELRHAFEKGLGIQPTERYLHHVFDDAANCLNAMDIKMNPGDDSRTKYNFHHITEKQSLLGELQSVLDYEILQAKQRAQQQIQAYSQALTKKESEELSVLLNQWGDVSAKPYPHLNCFKINSNNDGSSIVGEFQNREKFEKLEHTLKIFQIEFEKSAQGIFISLAESKKILRPLNDEKLSKIRELCMQYLKHTWDAWQENPVVSPELLSAKEKIIKKLYFAQNIQEANDLLRTNKNQLAQHRTKPLYKIFQAMAIILTLPISLPLLSIYSKNKRGSFNFMKSEGELMEEKLRDIIDADKPSGQGKHI